MNKTHSLTHFVYLVGLYIYYKMIHGHYNIKLEIALGENLFLAQRCRIFEELTNLNYVESTVLPRYVGVLEVIYDMFSKVDKPNPLPPFSPMCQRAMASAYLYDYIQTFVVLTLSVLNSVFQVCTVLLIVFPQVS